MDRAWKDFGGSVTFAVGCFTWNVGGGHQAENVELFQNGTKHRLDWFMSDEKRYKSSWCYKVMYIKDWRINSFLFRSFLLFLLCSIVSCYKRGQVPSEISVVHVPVPRFFKSRTTELCASCARHGPFLPFLRSCSTFMIVTRWPGIKYSFMSGK